MAQLVAIYEGSLSGKSERNIRCYPQSSSTLAIRTARLGLTTWVENITNRLLKVHWQCHRFPTDEKFPAVPAPAVHDFSCARLAAVPDSLWSLLDFASPRTQLQLLARKRAGFYTGRDQPPQSLYD